MAASFYDFGGGGRQRPAGRDHTYGGARLAYRDREEGLQPAQAPTWVAQATYLGLAVSAVAVLVIATTVIARALRRGSGPA